ncbi:SRPBCC domain-containing protein [Sphingomonas sp. MG17]|uniref:SRPBCC domain-containing protein n=1 Tax=Sphingomonas tagetis TaxID=2949092 RepID=A0A9X2HH85_9SPHN|nr:SRPBCC domain-containing protein [Sphingomonas tagetis]MCP3729134.1 SRPBCC domain-containing protein [Sphingomonas tagetis]
MTMMYRKTAIAAAIAIELAVPAHAEVTKSEPGGFVSVHKLVIAAPPEKVWDTIAKPNLWWSKDHTYSGDNANLSIDARPGGCWCEKLKGGSIEHARVIYADRGKVLRFDGAFGPLQSGAVTGTLTFALKAEGQGTAVTITYVVGGFHPGGLQGFAAPVDGVFAAQMPALKRAAEAR